MNSDAADPIGQFFSESWAVYEKVMEADYLSHRGLYDGLAGFFHSRPGKLRLLELGCGDCRLSAELLWTAGVAEYLGFDSSGLALGLARGRLGSRGEHWRLRQGDVRSCLSEVDESWDLVLASFCLHHLTATEKRSVLRELRRIVPVGGAFLLVDVFLAEGESREDYLLRRHAAMRRHWNRLSPAELDLITQHECESDFPETVSDYQRWARESGFQGATLSLALDEGMHSWMTFQG